jgi:hypothetical protein
VPKERIVKVGYSNKHNLPLELVRALTANRYISDSPSSSKTDFSITGLIAPTQQTILKKRYPDCSEGDVIENLWSMFGSIAHQLLEEHGSEDSLTEERFYTNVLDKTISGGIDHFKGNQATDYKVTSVWKVKKNDYTEWEQQLNCYRWLLEENGHKIDSIRIIAILRDWNKGEMVKDPDYPRAPIQIIELPVWQSCEAAAFIWQRVAALKNAENLPDNELPNCTVREMWGEEDKWAVMKEGLKRALKLYTTEQEAIENLKPNCYIQFRKGKCKRCLDYCEVSTVCSQNNVFTNNEQDENDEETIF